jgi:methionine biosynthesis protein MetW
MSKPSTSNPGMRFDLQLIASWIRPGAKVLDLGCGWGDLLQFLVAEKQVQGAGIEIYEERVAQCVRHGLSVVQGDLNAEIRDYPDQSFDYVVLSQTLQQVYDPAAIIHEMLRVGRFGIVSFPNFSHWRIRLQLLFRGQAPVSRELPYQWHDTPNIRVITIEDFRSFCRKQSVRILEQIAINTFYHDTRGHVLHLLPNLRGTYGVFLLARGDAVG